jgi:hypothetical protein
MGYSYDRATGRLCCDNCGMDGGVRKRRCPAGWCPPWALCPACWTRDDIRARWKGAHATCQASSDEFAAKEAERDAEPDRYPRAASWVGDGTYTVVLTRADTVVYMPRDDYDAGERLPATAKAWTPESGVELPSWAKEHV